MLKSLKRSDQDSVQLEGWIRILETKTYVEHSLKHEKYILDSSLKIRKNKRMRVDDEIENELKVKLEPFETRLTFLKQRNYKHLNTQFDHDIDNTNASEGASGWYVSNQAWNVPIGVLSDGTLPDLEIHPNNTNLYPLNIQDPNSTLLNSTEAPALMNEQIEFEVSEPYEQQINQQDSYIDVSNADISNNEDGTNLVPSYLNPENKSKLDKLYAYAHSLLTKSG